MTAHFIISILANIEHRLYFNISIILSRFPMDQQHVVRKRFKELAKKDMTLIEIAADRWHNPDTSGYLVIEKAYGDNTQIRDPNFSDDTSLSSDFQMEGKKIKLSRKRPPELKRLYKQKKSRFLQDSLTESEEESCSEISVEMPQEPERWYYREKLQNLKDHIKTLHDVISKRGERINCMNDLVRQMHNQRVQLKMTLMNK